MRRIKVLLRRGWRLAHRAAPALAERIDDRRRVRIRSAAAVSGVVRFEERIAALERDLDLISKQLAVLTMRVEQPSTVRSDPAPDEEGRILKARLSAVAFYEERISRLEAAAGVAVTPSGEVVPDSPR